MPHGTRPCVTGAEKPPIPFPLKRDTIEMPTHTAKGWSPESWKSRLQAQQVVYADRPAVERAYTALRALPPLVTSFEIEKLKALIAEAQEGKRFFLQGGDCAEQLADCRPEAVAAKLKILLQMSVVLIHGSKRPVIRVGRFAGQYAKPRSSPTETRTVDGREVTLPSYYGDLVNGAPFDADSRRPDPRRLLDGYFHAAVTLNFIRSLLDGGFADLHHPEYWELGFMRNAGLPDDLRAAYHDMTERLADGLRFMEAIGEKSVADLNRVEFFTSHEGLNLLYESAQTRTVPRREGWFNLSTHLPWVGERTRAIDGAHVEYFRGIRNPVGIKIGPATTSDELLQLLDVLDPVNEPGKIVLITRMGVANVESALPPLVRRIAGAGRRVLWVCDPMHGNPVTTSTGTKTRSFEHITRELESSWAVLRDAGTRLGGVHLELTGEDVTECIGGRGGNGVTEADLVRNFASPCDPRLNYEQSMELAFLLARRMSEDARS